MTDPRLDFIDRLQAATRDRMQRVERVAEQVGSISGEATSPDRLVTVKASANGGLLDLVIEDDALDLDARELAALVLATARTATERAAAAMKEAVSPLDDPPDVGPPGSGRGVDGSASGPPAGTAFDAALERAERVAETVEDRVHAMDGRPR